MEVYGDGTEESESFLRLPDDPLLVVTQEGWLLLSMLQLRTGVLEELAAGALAFTFLLAFKVGEETGEENPIPAGTECLKAALIKSVVLNFGVLNILLDFI